MRKQCVPGLSSGGRGLRTRLGYDYAVCSFFSVYTNYVAISTVLALIYGMSKNNYISDRSRSIRMC